MGFFDKIDNNMIVNAFKQLLSLKVRDFWQTVLMLTWWWRVTAIKYESV